MQHPRVLPFPLVIPMALSTTSAAGLVSRGRELVIAIKEAAPFAMKATDGS